MTLSKPSIEQEEVDSRRFARNTAMSWLSSLVKGVSQLIMLPVMAHLLGPSAFGIYALAQPTVSFFVTLAESGIGLSLAREDEANTLIWSTAYWLLLFSFSIMAVCVAASGYILSALTGHAELISVMLILSAALPLMAVSIAPDARILRRGDLSFHSMTEMVSTIVSSFVAIAAAFSGWSVWSLAFQYLSIYVIRAVMLNFIAFKRPSFEFQFSALAGHLNMSGALLARRSGELIAKSFENALYERIFGAASLGSYSVATQVTRFGCDLFMNPPIGSLYAFAIRNEERNVRALHFKIFRYLSFVLIPGVALAVAIAPSLFSLVLSDNWSLAALIFQPLALGYAFTALSGLNDAVLMSGNKTWRATIPALSAAIGRIFAVSAGFWFSPVIVAWLVCFLFIAQAIWLILGTPRSLAFGLHVLFRTWASASFCAVVVYIVCSALLDIGDGPAFLGIAILGGVVSWFLTVFGFLHKEIRSHAAPFIRNNFFRR